MNRIKILLMSLGLTICSITSAVALFFLTLNTAVEIPGRIISGIILAPGVFLFQFSGIKVGFSHEVFAILPLVSVFYVFFYYVVISQIDRKYRVYETWPNNPPAKFLLKPFHIFNKLRHNYKLIFILSFVILAPIFYSALRIGLPHAILNAPGILNLFGKTLNINSISRDGKTLLMRACLDGDLKKAEDLIKNGADVNVKDETGNNALKLMIVKSISPYRVNEVSYLEIMKSLVQAGLKINAKDNEGFSAIHEFVREHSNHTLEKCIEFLVQNGADINEKDGEGFYPIDRAIYTGNVIATKIFLKYNVDILHGRKNIDDMLIYIIRLKDVEILKQLYQYVSNVNQENYIENFFNVPDDKSISKKLTTPLIEACESKKIEAISFLLEQGADPNLEISDPSVRFLIPLEAGREEKIIQLLLEHGADKNKKDKNGLTAYDVMKKSGIRYPEKVFQLLKPSEVKEEKK